MKVRDFFEHRTNYAPLIVETMDSGMHCEDIYSEGEWMCNYSKEAEESFLEEWGEENISTWCIVGIGGDGEAVCLRIEIA